MNIRQLFDLETCSFSYLIWDSKTLEAAIIDPVLEQVNRDVALIEQLDLKLKYLFETHIHADHITGAGRIRQQLGAQIVVHENAEIACADILAKEGDAFYLGHEKVRVMHTPGHTNTDISYLTDVAVFTGDTLFVRDCGRTDFQQGDNRKMFDSLNSKLFMLPDDLTVFPAHDYKGFTSSTIGEEKRFNQRLGVGRSFSEFAHIMDNLNLPQPKRIDVAVPGNLNCGEV